jgi:hypothetical protein
VFKTLKITLGSFQIFLTIPGDICKSRYSTGINNTSGKFATSVNDTGVNYIDGKFVTGINNNGDKFVTRTAGVVDTGGK